MRFLLKHIHWILLLLIPFGVTKHILLLHQLFGFDWNVAIADAVCNVVIVCLAVWGIILLIRAYPTKVTIYSYSLLIAFILSLISIEAESLTLQSWLKNTPSAANYLLWLRTTLPLRFMFIWLFYSWAATNTALRKNITALNTRFQQQADATILLRDAELFKLRQQLQPHFLYNSLNSISALVMIAPDRAQEMIGKLSDFLRGSVKRESEDKVLLSEELLYVESYLAIESVRFGDRLQVLFEKNFDAHAVIPPFLFQPVLENAIKFGLYGKIGQVLITIQIHSDAEMLMIKVHNPFDPNTQPPRGTGFGLEGINRRLYLLYARTDLLETQKDEETFTTILKIPQHHV